MSGETLSMKFSREWGDHAPGSCATLPAALVRHLVDAGFGSFSSDAPAPAAAAERAEMAKPKNTQRATK